LKACAFEAQDAPNQWRGEISVFKNDGEIEIGFLLVPNFPLVCLSSALDVLRHANMYAEKARYRYRTYAEQGGTVRASNGLEIQAGDVIAETADPALLFVCAGSAGGADPLRGETTETRKWLRHLARNNTPLGGISAGTFILARSGLMDGYQCAVHWDDATVFRETFPEIELSNQVFIIDRDRLSCSGGAATIDMMLRIVAEDLGPEIAAKVAEMMLVDRVRSTLDKQASAALYKAKARSEPLARAIEAMELNIEAPLSMIELATHITLTRRQLHRLFRQHTGQTPTDFYRDLRLRHARSLLHGTPAKIIDVAMASGFGSHSHFTKVYRERFGVSPLKDRREDL
jgi:transcriptional regulator GlxA family with amidase domain